MTTTTQDELIVADDGGARWITLNRPGSRNALTVELWGRLVAAVEDAAANPDVRAVAIAGAGGAFCSGLDLKAAAAGAIGSPADLEENFRRRVHGTIRAIRACPKPVVAVVDGPAVGWGCDLALACDLRLCSDGARFGQIFVKRGLMPDGGGTFFLPRIVGLGRALELMYTGDLIDAACAHRIGLANQVVPAVGFEAAAAEYLARLAAGAPLVHAEIKRSVYDALDKGLEAALDRELAGQLRLLGSRDFAEGIAAFLEKRPPVFRGE